MRTILIALLVFATAVAASVAESWAAVRVFVTNEKSNDVTVIDAASGKVLKTIPLGQRPRGIAVSPDGTHVYVTNSNSNTLSVIDAATLAVLTTVPAGQDPEGLTPSKDGRLLYVVNENELAMTILELPSLKELKKLEIGTEPETAVMSPDGKWVTVSHETSNDIYVIDTATNAVTRKIPVPKNPRGMRFTPDSRRLFVASEGTDQISVINVADWTVRKSVATGGERPVDILVSRDGKRAYVSHGKSGDVRVVDTESLKVLAAIPVGPRAWWMAFTPDESRLYVSHWRAEARPIAPVRDGGAGLGGRRCRHQDQRCRPAHQGGRAAVGGGGHRRPLIRGPGAPLDFMSGFREPVPWGMCRSDRG
jgi:YVTN family beta-propeller protein